MQSLVEDLLSLPILTKLIAVILFAAKMLEAFALHKVLTYFSAKHGSIFTFNWKFNPLFNNTVPLSFGRVSRYSKFEILTSC